MYRAKKLDNFIGYLNSYIQLDGIHLILVKLKHKKVLIEYNRLRTLYCPDLANLSICRKRVKKIEDNEWTMRFNISNIQENVENSTKNKTIQRKRRKKE